MKQDIFRISQTLLFVLVLILISCLMTGCTADEIPTRVAPDLTQIAWDDMTIFREGLISHDQNLIGQMTGASIYHIDFRIAEDLSGLTGSQVVRYTNTEDEPLADVYFRLFPNYSDGQITVTGVLVDGRSAKTELAFQDSALRVMLPDLLVPDNQVEIEMEFEVSIPLEMGGNYGLFGFFEDLLVLDSFYPAIPVYDRSGWNVEVPPGNGDVTFFDASFYIVKVRAPKMLVVVASGIEIGRDYEKDVQILTFVAGPARDFYLAAGKDLTLVTRQVGETTVNSYSLKDQAEHRELALNIAAEAFKIFNERFGTFPYTEFDVVSTPMQARGIEYPGIVGISLKLYDPDEEVSGLPSEIILEAVVVHEIAHQWFYNVVGNDQVDEPWVDESLTQYATGLYYTDAYGEEAAQSYQSSWYDTWGRIAEDEIPIGLPSASYASEEYTPIIYGRGPIFLTTLADVIGQETLDDILQEYVEAHWWGIGTGKSFREFTEQGCSCDLTTLWEEWVYGE